MKNKEMASTTTLHNHLYIKLLKNTILYNKEMEGNQEIGHHDKRLYKHKA